MPLAGAQVLTGSALAGRADGAIEAANEALPSDLGPLIVKDQHGPEIGRQTSEPIGDSALDRASSD